MQALKNARPPATPRGIRLAVVMIEMGIEINFRGAGEPFERRSCQPVYPGS